MTILLKPCFMCISAADVSLDNIIRPMSMHRDLWHHHIGAELASFNGLRSWQSQPTCPEATSEICKLATPRPSSVRRIVPFSGNVDPRLFQCG